MLRKWPNWFNLEVFNKNETKEVVSLEELLPREFLADDLGGKFSGKWIYFSLGSMGSADLDLVGRLLKPLAKTNHKYIVSKGKDFFTNEKLNHLVQKNLTFS